MSRVGLTVTLRPPDPGYLKSALTRLENMNKCATTQEIPAFVCQSESMGKILRQWTETCMTQCRHGENVPDELLHLAHLCIWAWASANTYQPMT